MDSCDPHTLPIYQKSLMVSDISRAVSTYFASEPNLLSLNRFAPLRYEIAMSLLNDAQLIPESVTETLNSSSREYRIRQLSLINIRLKNILSYCKGLEMDGIKEKEYVNLLRGEIKSFKKAFKSWRKSILLT